MKRHSVGMLRWVIAYGNVSGGIAFTSQILHGHIVDCVIGVLRERKNVFDVATFIIQQRH